MSRNAEWKVARRSLVTNLLDASFGIVVNGNDVRDIV